MHKKRLTLLMESDIMLKLSSKNACSETYIEA